MTSAQLLGVDHVQLAMPAGGEESARGFYGLDGDFRPARKAHPGLLVRDLAALAEALAAAGVKVTAGEPLPGYEHVYVDDPFGNRLELLQRL